MKQRMEHHKLVQLINPMIRDHLPQWHQSSNGDESSDNQQFHTAFLTLNVCARIT